MSSTKRSIYELDLLDDFLFTEASMDKQTSELLIRLIVERALGVKIGKLKKCICQNEVDFIRPCWM